MVRLSRSTFNFVTNEILCIVHKECFSVEKISEDEGKELEKRRELCTIAPTSSSLTKFENQFKMIMHKYLLRDICRIILCYIY